MPLIFYSFAISAVLSILAVRGLEHLGFDMVGVNGAALGILLLGIVHVALLEIDAWRLARRFDEENRARRLIGLPDRHS